MVELKNRVEGEKNGSSKPLNALVFGTGGASRAAIYVLHKHGIAVTQVSRTADEIRGIISYDDLKKRALCEFQLLVNATPLGMYPAIDTKPDLNYEQLTEAHFLYDLVYNPAETAFLREGKRRNCGVQNGLPMLHAQAEAAWQIWAAI